MALAKMSALGSRAQPSQVNDRPYHGVEEKTMLPSHFQASKETITRLMSIAAGLGLKGYELGDKVNEFKQNEAKMINQQGLKAQIDYIFESFGPEGIEKAAEEIRNVLLDYAKAGQIKIGRASCRERVSDYV